MSLPFIFVGKTGMCKFLGGVILHFINPLEPLEIVTPLEPRDPFYGGRMEVFTLYKEAGIDATIKYYEVTSLLVVVFFKILSFVYSPLIQVSHRAISDRICRVSSKNFWTTMPEASMEFVHDLVTRCILLMVVYCKRSCLHFTCVQSMLNLIVFACAYVFQPFYSFI
jgi:hypothetical protein